MKMKIFAFAIFLAVMFAALSSATLTISPVSVPTSVTLNQGSTTSVSMTFNITSDMNESTLGWSGNTNMGTLTLPANTTITAGQTRTLSATLSIPKQSSGIISANINAAGSSGATTNLPINIQINNVPSLSIVKTRELTRTQNGTINITNNGNTALSSLSLTSTGDFSVTFSDTLSALNVGESKVVTVIPGSISTLGFGSNTVTIMANDANTGVNASTSFSLSNTFCKAGDVGGNLTLSNIDITSTGDDDTVWKPFDEVTVTVEVTNDGDNDIREIQAQLGIFDSNDKNRIGDLVFSSDGDEKIDIGTINNGDREEVEFKFRVPADFNDGHYKLAVKAFSKRAGETVECTDTSTDLSSDSFEDIDVEKQSDEGKFIAFDDIQLSSDQVSCGESVTLNLNTFNIGDTDQDQVKVNLFNRELGLDLSREIKQGLNQGDKEYTTFTFTVPTNAAGKTYQLDLSSQYDYRSGTYRQSSDDATQVPIKVVCTSPTTPGNDNSQVTISASLASDAVAGKQMQVVSTIRNTGTDTKSFVIDVKNYEEWATLSSISDRIVTLTAGQSKDVTLTFDVKANAAGDQAFTIQAQSGNTLQTREVAVTVAKGSSGAGFSLGNNGLIWAIAAVNIILIILIIVVAVRISRK